MEAKYIENRKTLSGLLCLFLRTLEFSKLDLSLCSDKSTSILRKKTKLKVLGLTIAYQQLGSKTKENDNT